MDIVSYNPGHDGALVHLLDGHLDFSIEAEKDSNYRYSPLSSQNVVEALGHLDQAPDVVAVGGWWPREAEPTGSVAHVGYRGIGNDDFWLTEGRLLGKNLTKFSSSHERSHLMSALGMSDFPEGTPCYALIWEGAIGAFYEIDTSTNITLLANVMNQPGNRYASIYGLADPTFPKNAPFSRLSDAGKLMALASFSKRSEPTADEEELMHFLLGSEDVRLDMYEQLQSAAHYNVGVDDEEFRNFSGIYSDRIFDRFATFAHDNLDRDRPLVIAGGCGLNCDWNSKWLHSDLFPDLFVPPVPNDSGSAIGTAIDAQFRLTGKTKIDWDVYAGLPFDSGSDVVSGRYDEVRVTADDVALMLASGLILGWAQGRYEIGPRALGNRSILAAPFEDGTRVRLNEIKHREQFRPIAPVCLEDDAAQWFGCTTASPFMLYTYRVRTNRTHLGPSLPFKLFSTGASRLKYARPLAGV